MQLTSFWALAAGPFAGSVAAVLVRRLPAGRPVALARSACETCGHPLAAWDLVPIVSFLALRGRCRHCRAPIAVEHLLLELAALALAALAILAGATGPALWADCAFAWVCLPLAVIDWQHLRLPDVLTLPLLLAGLATTAALDAHALTDHALAAAIGYAGFRLVALAYRWRRGREGLGAGDAKFIAAVGAWQGLTGLSDTLLIGAAAALAFGLLQRARGLAAAGEPIPFGPFLAFGAISSSLWFPP